MLPGGVIGDSLFPVYNVQLTTVNGHDTMGNRGRFGKYSEIKRLSRLLHSRKQAVPPLRSDMKSPKSRASMKISATQKPQVSIRPAKDSDASFIGRLSGKVFSIYGPSYEETVPRWLELEMTHTIMADIQGSPAGFAILGQLSSRYDQTRVSELLAIAVEPMKQGLGVGQRLLREIEGKAVELDIRRIFLHTATSNLSARKLFAKKGYSPWQIKRQFYPAGQDAVVMSKEIPWLR